VKEVELKDAALLDRSSSSAVTAAVVGDRTSFT
jgi:hypothetical protein